VILDGDDSAGCEPHDVREVNGCRGGGCPGERDRRELAQDEDVVQLPTVRIAERTLRDHGAKRVKDVVAAAADRASAEEAASCLPPLYVRVELRAEGLFVAAAQRLVSGSNDVGQYDVELPLAGGGREKPLTMR
jgi:hypothetical protein